MKKWQKILIIVVAVILVIAILIFAMSKVNKNTFEEKMLKNDFKITDVTSSKKFNKEKTIIKAIETTEKDKKYSIYLLEFSSEKTATDYFNKERKNYNSKKDDDSAINYTVVSNKERYTITMNNNRYINLYRDKNKIVFYDIDMQYSEEVIDLLEKLGY